MKLSALNCATRRVVVCACLFCGLIGAGAAGPDGSVPESLYTLPPGHNRIDDLVVATLRKKGIPPSGLCPDEVFIRRVFLDVIGTLPSAGEVLKFLDDRRPDKRAAVIDALLARDEFAAYWGLKWGDLLRIKSEFPSNLWPNAVQGYDRWVRDSLRRNKAYDQFVRELLTSSGSNFRSPPSNFYRAFQGRTPQQIAENVALLFMGVRLNGTDFTPEQILGLSAFFSKIGYKGTEEWKEEIVFFNPDGILTNAASGRPVIPRTPDGRHFKIPADQDPRLPFADWLTAPDNPWFARTMGNRIWYWLMGRGVVQEPDDMRASNPPWSPELLDYLGRELVSHKFDLKHLYRLILNSSTYQASSLPNAWNASDEEGFSHYRARRLVERGVPFVTINHQGWDTHKKHFQEMNRKLPELDQGVSALLQDLAGRGLLETTIVWVSGEFGRTPKIQWEAPWDGGRGHYGKAFSALVAGGGFRGGTVVGKTDERGETVLERPVYPWDLIGSMLELLGIDPAAKLVTPQGVEVAVSPLANLEIPAKETGGLLKEIM